MGMNGTYNIGYFNGLISGSGNVSWDGGKARVTLGANNTYTGATMINNGDIGVIAIGVDNALPQTTSLQFGNGANATQVGMFDLNGHSQRVASIVADGTTLPNLLVPPGQKAGGIANTSIDLATLIISGTATTTFTATIGTPQVTTINGGAPANHIAIELDSRNTGTLILNDSNNFDGGVTINGGTLPIDPNIYISGTSNAGLHSSSLPDNST